MRGYTMDGLSRRFILGAGIGAGMYSLMDLAFAAGIPESVMAAPTGASILLADMVASGALSAKLPHPDFSLWYSIDDLRAAVISGKCKLFSTPTNVPANLAVRGVPVKLLCMLGWGHLAIVSSRPEFHSFADLAGHKVLGFFPHDMPDLVFRATAKMEGVHPEKDFPLSYVQSPMESAQMLVAGRAETAVLSEPLATAAIMRAEKAGRKLYRAIVIEDVWKRHRGGHGIPMVGVAVHEDLLTAWPDFVHLAYRGLERSFEKIEKDHGYGADIATRIMHVQKPIFLKAFSRLRINLQPASAVKAELMQFYETLLDLEPRALGGHLPPEDFYLSV